MTRYPGIQRLLHWVIAVLVIVTLAIGQTIDIYGGFGGTKEVFGGELTGMFYKYHKTFGVLILALMIIRIVVKIRMGKPAYATPLKKFDRIASNSVHGVFYVSLVLMAVLGWLGTGAGGFPVQFFEWNLPKILAKDKELYETLMDLHGLVGKIIMICIFLHIGGALKHWLIDRDGVMGRMRPF